MIDAGQTKRSALVQNTSTGSVTIELAGVAGGRSLAVAEMIHSSELRRTFASSTPPISPLTAGPDVTLPANSFARLVWRS